MTLDRITFDNNVMGVSARCVEWLRSLGHDAVHLYEQRLHTLSDGDEKIQVRYLPV